MKKAGRGKAKKEEAIVEKAEVRPPNAVATSDKRSTFCLAARATPGLVPAWQQQQQALLVGRRSKDDAWGRRWRRPRVQRSAWAPQRWAPQPARLLQPAQALPWRLALAQR